MFFLGAKKNECPITIIETKRELKNEKTTSL
jgi:TusA-related sulfurtransferase